MTEYVAEVRDKGEVTIPKDLRKKKNPNEDLIREVILEDLPLFKMLATNGKSKSETET